MLTTSSKEVTPSASPTPSPVADEDCRTFQISAGREPKLTIINGKGELFIQKQGSLFTAKINGELVPETRMIHQGNIVRVLSSEAETLFMIAAFPGLPPDGQLVYSPGLDPYTSQTKIGVKTGPMEAALATQLNLDPRKVVFLRGVCAGGPAHKAGLQKYDIITQVDGEAPATRAKFEQAVSQKNPGDVLKLRVIRNGKTEEIVVTIESDERWMDTENLEKHYRIALTNLNSLGKRK